MNDLENYCRLCADLKESSDLINMESDIERRRELANKLARFNVAVNFDNMLPKTVCVGCLKSLDFAYDFVAAVDAAQEAFTDYISSPDIKKEKDNNAFSEDDTDNYEDLYTNSEDDITVKDEPLNKETLDKIEIIFKPEIENADIKPENVIDVSLNKTQSSLHSKKVIKAIEIIEQSDSWNNYDWICAFCDRCFRSPSELRVHSMQYHSTCNAFRCFDCKARGIHIDNFIAHICRHRPSLLLTCYVCSVTCTSLKELKKHKASHLLTDYRCIGCNMTFSSQEQLDEHDINFYKNAEANILLKVPENDDLTCVFCQKTSKAKFLLNRHLLIHTDRKREHVCDVCGKSFYHKKELAQHSVVHSDARPFQCEICKFTFKVKSELKKHVTIHFGPKQFECEQCGRCFRLRKMLVTHRAVHSEIRPYVCTHCNKGFRFRHLLRQHLLLHTDIKPYTCSLCTQKFRNWSNYNKHSKEVHGVDNSKRRRTADGLFGIDPDTKEVIYPEKDKVLEWKKKILVKEKKGRPRKDLDCEDHITETKS